MDAAKIKEMNEMRLKLGMKPLPVPGAEESSDSEDELHKGDEGSTLEKREAAGWDNFQKLLEEKEKQRKREERAVLIKKAREKALREAKLDGKGIGDDNEDEDTKGWLRGLKEKQVKIEKTRKAEEEKAAASAATARDYKVDDLEEVNIAHEMSTFLGADEQVLTLKDSGVLENEKEGDQLENLNLCEQEKLQERLDLKRKKPLYDPLEDDEAGILAKYDEAIDGKKKKVFLLSTVKASDDLADILAAPAQPRKTTTADMDEPAAPLSTCLDPSAIKIKKPKKKNKVTRKRTVDNEDSLVPTTASKFVVEPTDLDTPTITFAKSKIVDGDFEDDEDLQASLARQRKEALGKKSKLRPEDIARQMRDEAMQSSAMEYEENAKIGLVIEENTGFLDMLGEVERETRTEKRLLAAADDKTKSPIAEDEDMKDDEMQDHMGETTAGVEDEKSVSSSMGAALSLLKSRGLIEQSQASELNKKHRQKAAFLTELHRRMALYDADVRKQREQDRSRDQFKKMSTREKEQYQQRQNALRDQYQARVLDQLYKEQYTPTVDIKYIDEHGRRLDSKEAFRHMSHMFHGKGSGKGKTDKKLKKIEAEKKKEAESILDVSQNVGMSSAASHQIKKRKEPGARLA